MKAAETSRGKCPLDIDLEIYECLFVLFKYGKILGCTCLQWRFSIHIAFKKKKLFYNFKGNFWQTACLLKALSSVKIR